MISCRIIILFIALIFCGCAGHNPSFEEIEFRAPSQPSMTLQPLLVNVDHIGVLCLSNIASTKELDIQKVLALLSNATLRGLSKLKDITIVSQDEILWKMNDISFDSTSVYQKQVQTRLQEELNIDAVVLIELRELQTRILPLPPTSYGMKTNPGIDMSLDLQISLVNVRTNETWKQGGKQRNVEPVRLQLLGNNKQGERQLLMSLSRPMQRFIYRIAPPAKTQKRYFNMRGN